MTTKIEDLTWSLEKACLLADMIEECFLSSSASNFSEDPQNYLKLANAFSLLQTNLEDITAESSLLSKTKK